jgi:hypothetical protein
MVMSVRYGVPYYDEGLLPEPRWQRRLRSAVVLRVIADPHWSTLGSMIAAGIGAAWMMVVLLKHVPLGL